MEKSVIRIKNQLGSMFVKFSGTAKPFFTTDIEKAKTYTDLELIKSDIAIIYAETRIRCYAQPLEEAKKDF